ncbi:FtsX-like permease family protein [Paractinoplanes lichenicola]|uniref:ABC transporter permease n=1 Tax=Paractinoplanes lichenicola TaxID=2802976 RepID=A0ABS1W635_9ACTN|nr:FtsX-like permease family protein [Actinoplanes lichenicola]MBL7262204.1 ABC transporter permease [Actinoplanes lichenicola]
MYYIALGAVRRRSGPALLLALLAALLATGASCAAWYGLSVASQSAGAEVVRSPVEERVILVRQAGESTSDPRAALDKFATTVRGMLPVPSGTPVLGVVAEATYIYPGRSGASTGLPIAYRDGFCDHVRLTGACPAAADDAVISADTARRLGLKTGDTFRVRAATSRSVPIEFRVTGVYEHVEPGSAYWSDKLFRAQGSLDPLFTSLDTFRDPLLIRQTYAWDLDVPLPLLRGDGAYDLNGLVNESAPSFAGARLQLATPTGKLVDRVREERLAVARGVAIGLGQLAVLAWFAIGLAGRYTGRERRADAGLLKLRGSTSRGILRLALSQHLLPLTAGGLAGWVAGFLVAWPLAGALPVTVELWAALLLSLGLVVVVLGIALLVLLAVDALQQRAPVAALLRRVPSARRDWRSGVIDLALIALAAGAVYQARTSGSGLGIVAPALVALAVGLLLARLLRRAADRVGAVALRAGRIRLGLTAVRVSRQPGTDRVFALVVVSVALMALTLGTFAAGRAERADRAGVELGAPRVLTVSATSRTELLYAVRRADPEGRYAMAAVVDTGGTPPVLAVDSNRLAAVATWRPEYGPVTALTATPAPAALPLITGDRLTVAVTSRRSTTTLLGAILQHEGTGEPVRVEFKGIRLGAGTASALVPRCATAPGCRLVGWELFTPQGSDDGSVTVRSLTQQGPAATVLTAAQLADVRNWRGDFSTPAVHIAAGDGGLTLQTVPAGSIKVAAADSPLPQPVVLAGRPPSTWVFDDSAVGRFGDPATPVRVAAAATVLPVLGRDGVLTDLDAARRVAGDSDQGGILQVWLTADAPDSVVDAIGLPVLADRTAVARAADLAADASVVTTPFGLFTAAVVALIAAALLGLAAAVDREPQLEHLRALRTQGLTRRVALGTAYAGAGSVALAGLLGGLAAALAARPLAAVTAPVFPDGWRVVPPPGALGPWALTAAALAGLVVFGATAWLSVRRLRGELS